jgi:hypothetical protein
MHPCPSCPAPLDVDYYAMFWLTPQHLLPVMPQPLNPIVNPITPPAALMLSAMFRAADATWDSGLLSQQTGSPSPSTRDEARASAVWGGRPRGCCTNCRGDRSLERDWELIRPSSSDHHSAYE